VGPLSFQPSELAKFALALYLAVLLSRNTERLKKFSIGFLPPLLMTGVIVGLVIIQPDLGTAVILGVTALGLLFVSGTRTKYIVLAVLVAAPLVWKVLITGTSWRMLRLLAFLEPEKYCKTAGYQLCESLISVGSGGVLGQGLGQSRNKLFFLPEAHTDFILAIVGEELGLVGILAVLAAFAVLVWRGLLASLRARDVFGSFLAFAITCLFALQALANMGVVLGLLPTKGLALPFISYGGTSLVMSLFMAGVLANISARNPEPRSSPLGRSWRRPRLPGKNKRAERGPTIIVDPPESRSRSHRAPAPQGAMDEQPTSPEREPDDRVDDTREPQ
jgi:cell division protein FtsW